MFDEDDTTNGDDSTDSETDDVEYVVYNKHGDEIASRPSKGMAEVVKNNQFIPSDYYIEEVPVEDDADDGEEELGTTMAENIEGAEPITPGETAPPEPTPSYGFLSNPTQMMAEMAAANESEPPMRVKKWSLGSHSHGADNAKDDIEAALADLDDEVDEDLKGVLQQAAGMVSESTVHDFECSICGLNHGHSDGKHDIREEGYDGLKVREDFAEQMEFSPFCHCGVNELAMLVDFYGYIDQSMFKDNGRFESVVNADPETVDVLLTTYSQVKNDDTVSQPMRHAAQEAGFSEGALVDVKAFLSRVDDIKNAALGAPISSETRADIDTLRDEVEVLVER